MEESENKYGAGKTTIRFDNIEFRWCNCNEQHEIVKWFKDENGKDRNCIMLAGFDNTGSSEGPDLRWVGNRPLQLDPDEFKNFIRCARFGYDFFQGRV